MATTYLSELGRFGTFISPGPTAPTIWFVLLSSINEFPQVEIQSSLITKSSSEKNIKKPLDNEIPVFLDAGKPSVV